MTHFSKGTYYIGDLCYVVKDNEWIPLLERSDYFDIDPNMMVHRGHKYFAAGTAYGDGAYHDQYGREYLVDSGTIGIMLATALGKNFIGKGGQIVEFDANFDVSAKEGVFHFGDITINTRDDDEEED